MKPKQLLISLISSPLCLFLISCGSSISTAENKPIKTDFVTTISNTVIIKNNLVEKVKFQKGNDIEIFSLRPKASGIKLEGAQGQAISNLTVDTNGKIKIETSAGSVLGYVSGNNSYWKLEDAEEISDLYILRKQADGDYQLESANPQQIYSIKSREYGFEIETPKNKSLYQVKREKDRLILQDADGNIVLKTKSNLPLLAIACYGFDVLDRSQQTALAYAVSLMKE